MRIQEGSMGDGDYRSYGFAYDPSNRLLRVDFNQRAGYNDWKKAVASNLNINFSMYMGDGINPSTAYDANGNILSMSQYGLQQNAIESKSELSSRSRSRTIHYEPENVFLKRQHQ